ncbi:MAG: asparagine synthase [Clostridiales bacterium]|nr:asparagine synthase [Clostridiales bacterium]
MFRESADQNKWFSDRFPKAFVDFPKDRTAVCDSGDLLRVLKKQIDDYTRGKKIGLALSGGIDSAILLKLMPQNTVAYTLKCVSPGAECIDESAQAKRYIDYAAPDTGHTVVPVSWEDMESLSPRLMRHKGAPIHSIEVQICKLAMQAKADGCDAVVFGETADCIYGGHSKLLARDWSFGEFVDRYAFVPPYRALKDPQLILEPFRAYEKDGYIDVFRFISEFVVRISVNSYINACAVAGIELFMPYAHTVMGCPPDMGRIRGGEGKYIVRGVFEQLYPAIGVPLKLPMPRPMSEWLKGWPGPVRDEFWPHCTDTMTGDQKWLVWSLERFLDILDDV